MNTNETRINKESQINIEKALEEDPNVFEYDSIYDKLEEEKKKSDPKAKNQSKEVIEIYCHSTSDLTLLNIF